MTEMNDSFDIGSLHRPASSARLRQILLGLCGAIVVLALWAGLMPPENGTVALILHLVIAALGLGVLWPLRALAQIEADYIDQLEGLETQMLRMRAQSARAEAPVLAPSRKVMAEPEPVAPPAPPPPSPPAPVLGMEDFLRALNFPNNAEDHAGVHSLHLALADPEAAKLIRSAQDVLNLLAQDSIYIDDLQIDPASADLWRRFAQGERGQTLGDLVLVRDRSSLALTGNRLRDDAVFRDAAHHFLRQFDRSYQAFEASASDQDILDLAQTRTARAFILLARVSGVFE